MSFVYRKYNEDITHLTVKLIDGSRNTVKCKSLVGYCHSNLHKGYITEPLMKQHQCLERGCPRFEKFIEYPYWVDKQKKKEQKAINKQKKERRIRHELMLDDKLNSMKSRAQNIANECGFPIIITKVHKNEDNLKGYIINYISDSYHYLGAVSRKMSYEYTGSFLFKRVKNVDGSYATIDDWLNAKR